MLNLRKKADPIKYSSTSVNAAGQLIGAKTAVSDFDKRIIRGYAIIWGQKNLNGEIFVKGCCAKSIRERGPQSNSQYKIKFLNQHKQSEAMALFNVLEEDDHGLYFETVPLDDVDWANDAITQLRSGTLNNFSHGWDYIWDKIEWDDVNEAIVLLEIDLYELSVVTIPSGMETYCIRSMEDQEDMNTDILTFINQLPRAHRLEARRLFTLQKSLVKNEPFEQRNTTLDTNKPTEKVSDIDYNYLINNLKLD